MFAYLLFFWVSCLLDRYIQSRKLLTSRPEGVLTIHEGRNLMLLDGRDRNSSRLR